ncbi:MAG: SWIM zinc finger family protein [Haloferacaceae archaeon]
MTHAEHTAASATHPATRPKTRLPVDGTEGRSRRARDEAMAVRPLRDGRYVVETDSGTYVVDLDARSCTCPDHAIRGARCKHLRRVAIEINEGRLPAPDRRTAICAVCGDPTFVPLDAEGARLCERHAFDPGDLVRDRESNKLLVVVEQTTERADERVVEEADRTVAAFETNANYGGHEPVIEAVYVPAQVPLDGDLDLGSRKRYGFPASRLVPVERGYVRVDEDPPAATA